MVDYSRAVVTGATYYDIHTHSDFVRYNLALESIKFLTQRGYEVVIVDGGSTRPFLSSAYDNGANFCLFNNVFILVLWSEVHKLSFWRKICTSV